MKRNLILLTAVVLAAVLLSGCVIWPFGVAVEYDLEPEVFAAHKNEKRVSKNAKFEPEFMYAEEADEDVIAELDVSVMAGTKEIEFQKEEIKNEDEEVTGIKVIIPSVGTKKFTISIRVPEAE